MNELDEVTEVEERAWANLREAELAPYRSDDNRIAWEKAHAEWHKAYTKLKKVKAEADRLVRAEPAVARKDKPC